MDQSARGAHTETPFDTFIRQFLHSKTNQRLSRRSQEIYQRDTQRLVDHLAACGLQDWGAVTEHHIQRLIDQVTEVDGGKRSRASRMLAITRLIFAYAVERSLIDEQANPLTAVPPARVDLHEIYGDAADAALASFERIPDDSPEHLRDRSLLRFMYLTGIWMGGVVAMNYYTPLNPPLCTVFPDGMVRYRSKGGLVEHTILDRDTMEWIDRWMAVRHRLSTDSREPALWITRQGGRILRSTIASRIRKHTEITEINPITEHLEAVVLMP